VISSEIMQAARRGHTSHANENIHKNGQKKIQHRKYAVVQLRRCEHASKSG